MQHLPYLPRKSAVHGHEQSRVIWRSLLMVPAVIVQLHSASMTWYLINDASTMNHHATSSISAVWVLPNELKLNELVFH